MPRPTLSSRPISSPRYDEGGYYGLLLEIWFRWVGFFFFLSLMNGSKGGLGIIGLGFVIKISMTKLLFRHVFLVFVLVLVSIVSI